MSILTIIKHILRHLFRRKPVEVEDPRKLVPRVRVLDNELNRENAHWRLLIGHEGYFLGAHVDEEGEVWDVQLTDQPIPHSLVKKERFEMLPPRV